MKNIIPPFGRVLRQFRQEKGLSQEELADRLDISPSHVSRMESGRKTPSLKMIFRLAAALEIKAHELIESMESE